MNKSDTTQFYYKSHVPLNALFMCIFLVFFACWTFVISLPLFVLTGFWGLLLAIPGIVWCSRQILKMSPPLILSDNDIKCLSWPFKRVQWKNICSAHLMTLPGPETPCRVFEIDNEIDLLNNISVIDRVTWKVKSWKYRNLLEISPILINLKYLDVVPKQIEEIILTKISNTKNNRR